LNILLDGKLLTNESILHKQIHDLQESFPITVFSFNYCICLSLRHFCSLHFAYQAMRMLKQFSFLNGNAMYLKCYNTPSLFLLNTNSKIKKQHHYNTLQLIWLNLLDGFIKSSRKPMLFIKRRNNQRYIFLGRIMDMGTWNLF